MKKMIWNDFEVVSRSEEKEIEKLISSGLIKPGSEVSVGRNLVWRDKQTDQLYVLQDIPVKKITRTVSSQHVPAVEKWVKKIEEFGFTDPVMVYPDELRSGEEVYPLQDGHHRYTAAVELGIEKIPAWVQIGYMK